MIQINFSNLPQDNMMFEKLNILVIVAGIFTFAFEKALYDTRDVNRFGVCLDDFAQTRLRRHTAYAMVVIFVAYVLAYLAASNDRVDLFCVGQWFLIGLPFALLVMSLFASTRVNLSRMIDDRLKLKRSFIPLPCPKTWWLNKAGSFGWVQKELRVYENLFLHWGEMAKNSFIENEIDVTHTFQNIALFAQFPTAEDTKEVDDSMKQLFLLAHHLFECFLSGLPDNYIHHGHVEETLCELIEPPPFKDLKQRCARECKKYRRKTEPNCDAAIERNCFAKIQKKWVMLQAGALCAYVDWLNQGWEDRKNAADQIAHGTALYKYKHRRAQNTLSLWRKRQYDRLQQCHLLQKKPHLLDTKEDHYGQSSELLRYGCVATVFEYLCQFEFSDPFILELFCSADVLETMSFCPNQQFDPYEEASRFRDKPPFSDLWRWERSPQASEEIQQREYNCALYRRTLRQLFENIDALWDALNAHFYVKEPRRNDLIRSTLKHDMEYMLNVRRDGEDPGPSKLEKNFVGRRSLFRCAVLGEKDIELREMP